MKKQFNLFVLPGMLLATTLVVMFFFQRVNGLFVESIWYDKRSCILPEALEHAF